MPKETINKIFECKIIAIIRSMEERFILPLAEAIYSGGISLIEITFNQLKPETFETTLKGIEAISKRFAGKIIPVAGTVLSPEQVKLAAGAGAKYIVSPNTNPDVIQKTKELGLVSIPGAMTPGECLAAHNAGADIIKLFPASDLGPGYLKAISAPLNHIKFLATGGINEKNAADFIRAGAVGVGAGGNLVNKDWIAAGEFDRITQTARALVQAVSNLT